MRRVVCFSLLVLVQACGPPAAEPDAAVDAAVEPPPLPALHVAVQNTWLAQAPGCGAQNDAISISGHYFLQEGTFGSDFATFLGRTQQEIEARLEGMYLANHPEVSSDTSGILIIDVEHPHLKNLHTYSATDQDAIVQAFLVRVAATRAVFPNARVGIYGTLIPDGRGEDTATYSARLTALIEAGGEGLYDQLDYIVSVLYARFGCDEVSGTCDPGWDRIGAYTQQAIDGSRQLRRSDGSSLPLLPLLSFRIHNSNSAFHQVLLLDLQLADPIAASLGVQMGLFEANGVADAVLWSGVPTEVLSDPNPNGRTVTDYVCSPSLRPQ